MADARPQEDAGPGPFVVLRLADDRLRLVAEGARVVLRPRDGEGEQVLAAVDLPNPQAAALCARVSSVIGLSERDLCVSRDAARLYLALERIRARSGVIWELRGAAGPIAQAVSVGPDFDLGPDFEVGADSVAAIGDAALDPAVHLRRAEEGTAEGASRAFPVVLSSPGLSCVIRLSAVGARQAAGLLAGVDDDGTRGLRAFLIRCGAGAPAEAGPHWDFHDRVLHGATRPPDDGRPIGVMPAAVQRPPPSEWLDAGVAPRADIDPRDPLVRRRTLRDFVAEAPSEAAIRTILSRTLAFQAIRGIGDTRWVERAFPAAGGLGEIIGYVAVRAAGGLAAGLYRHDPLHDRLESVASDPVALGTLFDGAATTMLRAGRPPPAILILASRVDQLAWKYGALGYRLALLNAGAAAAVVQLAAGDAGLGCCALGTSTVRHLPTLRGHPEPASATGGHEEVALLEIAFGVRPGGRGS